MYIFFMYIHVLKTKKKKQRNPQDVGTFLSGVEPNASDASVRWDDLGGLVKVKKTVTAMEKW